MCVRTSFTESLSHWICHVWYIKTQPLPVCCGLVDWVLAYEPKGHWFDSQSEHMPGLWARSPVGGTWEATTYWCFCPSLCPSLLLSLKNEKKNLKKKTPHNLYICFFKKDFIYLFTFREGEGGRETSIWVRNIDWLPLSQAHNQGPGLQPMPVLLMGIRNRTCDLWFTGPKPNSLSHTSQGQRLYS